MDPTVYQYVSKREELIRFIRLNPVWYRYLSRDPKLIAALEKEAKIFYGKTLPQRIEKINNNIQMLNMLAQFAGAMRD